MLLIRLGIARGWIEAMEMPADLALRLLHAMQPATGNPPGKPPGKPQRKDSVETMPDGSKKVSFADIKDLSQALAAAGWSGVKIGGK